MKKLTHKDYIERVFKVNPNIEVLGKYIDSKTKILHKCKICGYEWAASPSNILAGYGCMQCYNRNRLKSRDLYINEVKKINPNIEILSEYLGEKKKIKFKCTECGYIDETCARNLLTKYKCNNCYGDKYVQRGVNDLFTLRPDIAKLMEDQDLSHKICCHSTKTVDFRCPRCNNIVRQRVGNVVKRGLSCKYCGDGISFPEKYVFNLLAQLELHFNTYVVFEWSDKRIYDICIYDQNNMPSHILEVHGGQHYYGGFERFGARTYEEEVKNDSYKMELAKLHGFSDDKYVIIDCRESSSDYIKNSIYNNEFFQKYNLNNINWKLCELNALSSYTIKAIELWELEYSVKYISKELCLSMNTIDKYLKRGAKLGICSYTIEKSRLRRGLVCNLNNNNIKLSYLYKLEHM